MRNDDVIGKGDKGANGEDALQDCMRVVEDLLDLSQMAKRS